MRKAPGLFLALFAALFMPLLTAGCAASDRTDVHQRLDVTEQNQQTLELRVSRVEERLSRVEKKEDDKPVPKSESLEPQISSMRHATLEPAPAQTIRSAWREAAPSQVTGTVDMLTREHISPQNLSLKQEPAPAPSLAAAPILVPPAPQPQLPQPPLVPQSTTRVQPDEKTAYDAALALYKRGEFGKAREAFQAFMQSFPGSALAPNALYWEAESLYARGLYDQAILVFQAVVNRFPKHDKAAAALLKTGFSYERLKDMDNARFFWQILLDDFPKSAPANLARQRMGSG